MIFLYYVQEADKPNILLNLFNIIRLEEDKIILPITVQEEINLKKARKLAQKTKKILDETTCNKIILSKEIKKQKDYKNYLYSNNIDIVDGKWLFEVLSAKILEYVINKKNMKKEETPVSILVNEMTENILENIKQIVREYKRVNIVTNHIGKFKKIEEEILKKDGIMINVNNNKRKSLIKSKIILNVDFPTELINKYNIYDEAIIVNLRGNVKINKKRFNGMNINNYQIVFYNSEEFDYDKSNLYEQKDIYEAQIYQKQPFEYIERKINRDKVKITQLVGNRTTL